jgi:hypothetical protein
MNIQKIFLIFIALCLIVSLSSCEDELVMEPVDLEDGLLVHYAFNGNVEDETGTYDEGDVFGATLTTDRNGDANSAYRFDGVNDAVDLGDILDNVDLPVTISAWIKPENSNNMIVFTSQDNLPVYNGFFLYAGGTTISAGYGDGLGENNQAYRRGKAATGLNDQVGEWVHVCAVIESATEMTLYVNGEDVDGVYDGSSNQDMDSDFPDDVARVGKWTSNGITSYFKGSIDEIKVWERALNPSEVSADME